MASCLQIVSRTSGQIGRRALCVIRRPGLELVGGVVYVRNPTTAAKLVRRRHLRELQRRRHPSLHRDRERRALDLPTLLAHSSGPTGTQIAGTTSIAVTNTRGGGR
jgi:hypothetical protein